MAPILSRKEVLHMFIIQVEVSLIVEGLRDYPVTEPFIFNDIKEAEKFRDHLRDLYALDIVDISVLDFDTYDTAIERMVEVFGPSDD